MNTLIKTRSTSAQEQKCTRAFDLCSYDLCSSRRGFVLPLVLVGIVILMALIIGATMTSYGSRLQAVQTKAQTEAMLAAEAGYEQALFWMSQRTDLLGDIQAGDGQGTIAFGTGSCSYEITFRDFIGARPVFRVISTGICGRPSFTRIVDVDVMQETSGWAMGACRVPNSGTNSPSTSNPLTYPVSFVNGEIINMPLHINDLQDSPDLIDISISGSPQFKQKVEMGESRKTSGGSDKYASVMSLFQKGIDFDQPGVRITDNAAVQSKINRFRDSTALAYRFTPVGRAVVGNPASPCDPCAAVQLQFYVDASGTGKVRIFPSCTIRHYRRSSSYSTWDYRTGPASGQFQKYDIYAYHYFDPNDGNNKTVNVTDTYVTQSFGGYTSEPGGQIYVNGNVIIGGDSNAIIDPCNFGNQLVKGKITVVATGNIWIGDSIYVQGDHDAEGMPTSDNPNVLGLIAQGIIKVVDPGFSSYGPIYTNYPAAADIHLLYKLSDGSQTLSAVGVPDSVLGANHKHYYCPIGNRKTGDPNNVRCLPHDVVVEAAITVGGGGWGAENVQAASSGPNRKEYTSGTSDHLSVHGSITEVIRGVVGLPSYNDGFLKEYTIDTRLMSGILPGDIWFSGKYIPAPAGWHDHSPNH